MLYFAPPILPQAPNQQSSCINPKHTILEEPIARKLHSANRLSMLASSGQFRTSSWLGTSTHDQRLAIAEQNVRPFRTYLSTPAYTSTGTSTCTHGVEEELTPYSTRGFPVSQPAMTDSTLKSRSTRGLEPLDHQGRKSLERLAISKGTYPTAPDTYLPRSPSPNHSPSSPASDFPNINSSPNSQESPTTRPFKLRNQVDRIVLCLLRFQERHGSLEGYYPGCEVEKKLLAYAKESPRGLRRMGKRIMK